MNISNKAKGFVCGAVAAATYGMNPLFTLPLYKEGLSVDSVLFYRYAFAVLILGILMKIQGQSFALKKNESTSATGRRIAFFRLFTTFIHEL